MGGTTTCMKTNTHEENNGVLGIRNES